MGKVGERGTPAPLRSSTPHWVCDAAALSPSDSVSLAYQRVQKVDCAALRPVLILGPLLDVVKEMLVNEAPGKFCRCPLGKGHGAPSMSTGFFVSMSLCACLPSCAQWAAALGGGFRSISEPPDVGQIHAWQDWVLTAAEQYSSPAPSAGAQQGLGLPDSCVCALQR